MSKHVDDIVDCIVKIMVDDGPEPRIKYKSTQKRPNGADQFCDEHQKDFDARYEHRGDETERVRAHNEAVPKLYDELKKKRSIAIITTVNLKDCDFDPKCSACAKLITMNELKRLNLKHRCKAKKPAQQDKVLEKQSRGRQKLTGVKKLKERRLEHSTHIKKHCTNRSFLCIADHKHNKSLPKLRPARVAQEKSTQDLIAEIISEERGEEHNGNRADSKQTLKSTNRSNSSFNSYFSLQHEPMDYN